MCSECMQSMLQEWVWLQWLPTLWLPELWKVKSNHGQRNTVRVQCIQFLKDASPSFSLHINVAQHWCALLQQDYLRQSNTLRLKITEILSLIRSFCHFSRWNSCSLKITVCMLKAPRRCPVRWIGSQVTSSCHLSPAKWTRALSSSGRKTIRKSQISLKE